MGKEEGGRFLYLFFKEEVVEIKKKASRLSQDAFNAKALTDSLMEPPGLN